MYKVIADYHPSANVLQGESITGLLCVEKGDILIDGEEVDDIWFQAKSALTGEVGRIPRENVESFCNTDKKDSLNFTYSDDNESESSIKKADGVDSPDALPTQPVAEDETRLETNYVKMSSTDSGKESGKERVVEYPVNPVAKPPRVEEGKLSDDVTKVSDEGYNSGSYYSGDTSENSQPLLPPTPVASKQDEAGYEVPQITVDDSATKSDDSKGKKRLLKGLFRARTFNEPSKGEKDDFSEKYYNPPADIRDRYFLPKSTFPIVRVLLGLIAALAISFTCLFVLLLSQHAFFSFVISLVLFVTVFMISLTLICKGLCCVMALIIPSIFSMRTKIAILILLATLLIAGPIIGIANKVQIAGSCNESPSNTINVKFWNPRPKVAIYPSSDSMGLTGSTVHKICVNLFQQIDKRCYQAHREFRKSRQCKLKSLNKINNIDKELCDKPRAVFCGGNSSAVSSCYVYTPKAVQKSIVRDILFYSLPMLILFLLSEAYSYNKRYLTTKDADNVYITQRLRELDSERKNRGLTDLILPLTRIEFQTYLLRGRYALSKAEKASLLKWMFTLLIFSFVSLCCIILEDRIHNAFLNSLVMSCKRLYGVSTFIRHRPYIYGTLGALLLIIITQSYMLRLRSIICDYVYRDMVDIRAKHLYYKILHDRHSFGRHVRRKIQLLAESKRLTRRISCSNQFYHVLPSGLKWLCNKLSIRRCMICDSVTYWKTVSCRESSCLAHYCYECYVDAGQVCLTCKIPSSPPRNPNGKPQPVAV